MKKVFLYGRLGKEFGKEFTLDINSPAEAVRALGVQLPGFIDAIRAGEWHIVRGPLTQRDSVSEEDLVMTLGCQNELHILPAIKGANNGPLMTIIGIIIVAVAWWNPLGWSAGTALMVGAAGAGMAVGGLITMTTKLSSADPTQNGVDERASYLFNGPTNQSAQGVAVPRGYGRVLVGSIVVSGGLFAEETTA